MSPLFAAAVACCAMSLSDQARGRALWPATMPEADPERVKPAVYLLRRSKAFLVASFALCALSWVVPL